MQDVGLWVASDAAAPGDGGGDVAAPAAAGQPPPRARFTLGSSSDDAARAPAAAVADGDLESRVCALSKVLSLLRVELLSMKAQDEELSQQFFGIGRAIQQLRQPPSSPSCDSTASFSDAGSVFGSDADLAQLHDTCEVEFRARTASLLAPACRRSAGVNARRKMCVSFDECGESGATTGPGRLRVAR